MKRKNIITGIVVMAMLLMMSMSAMAASDVVVYLPENQVWTGGYPEQGAVHITQRLYIVILYIR